MPAAATEREEHERALQVRLEPALRAGLVEGQRQNRRHQSDALGLFSGAESLAPRVPDVVPEQFENDCQRVFQRLRLCGAIGWRFAPFPGNAGYVFQALVLAVAVHLCQLDSEGVQDGACEVVHVGLGVSASPKQTVACRHNCSELVKLV